MRNLRALIVLTVLVAGLLTLNISFRHGFGEAKASDRTQLVETTDALCGIRLERKGGASVELRKNGQAWKIAVPYPGSVDEQIMMRFLDVLSMTPITDRLYDSALLKLGRTRADFDLAEPPLRLVLSFENGASERIGFGAVTPLPGGVFVSIDGLDSVFVVPTNVLASVDVGAESFRRRALFTFGPDAVSSFTIKHQAEAPLEFVRGNEGWRVGDSAVSAQKVADFLSGVTSSEALDFVWPVGASNETEHASAALLAGYGLDPDAAITVVLKDMDGVDRRVSFGKESGEGRVYALIHGGTAIVTVPAELKVFAEQGEGVFADSRIFPVDARSVGMFSIVDTGVQYAFARGKDGGWFIESPIVAAADGEVVNGLLSRIIALSASDVVSSGEGVEVSLSTNAEKSVVSRATVFGNLTPEDLRSKEILRIDSVQARRIVRTADKEKGPVAIVYDRERKAWNVESGTSDGVADARGIESVLSAINPLVALRIEKLKVSAADLDDYGLDLPFLTVAVDQEAEGSVRRNIIIGKKAKDGRYATIGASDAVFVMGEEQVNRLSAAIVGK